MIVGGEKMFFLRKLARYMFYKFYKIEPYDNNKNLSVVCNGRIIRSLSDSKKEVCSTHILNEVINLN